MDMLPIAVFALAAIIAIVAGIYVIRPEKKQQAPGAASASKEKGPHSLTGLF